MSKRAKAEYLKEIRKRYNESDKEGRQKICRVCKQFIKREKSQKKAKKAGMTSQEICSSRDNGIFKSDMEGIKSAVFEKIKSNDTKLVAIL